MSKTKKIVKLKTADSFKSKVNKSSLKQSAVIKNWENYIKAKNGSGGVLDTDPTVRAIQFAEWHILAEGDSWNNFNEARLEENLLQELLFDKPTAIANISLSGDNIAQIINPKVKGLFNGQRVAILNTALEYQKWDMILISAGGNDLIDSFSLKKGYEIFEGKSVRILKKPKNIPTKFEDFIDEENLKAVLEVIKSSYKIFIDKVRATKHNKKTKIIGHTYDYFTLRIGTGRNKSIRQKAMEEFGVPVIYWKQITGYLNLKLAEALLDINKYDKNVFIANTLDTLVPADPDEPGNTRHWRNEIHPNNEGYRKIARDRINEHLRP